MAITASQVSELRKLTDCGMMDCKKALEEAQGDLDVANEILRKKGILKAEKKACRVASEGVILIKMSDDATHAIMIEVNSETDFVARDANFLQFTHKVAELALEHQVNDIALLNELAFDSSMTVEQARQALIAKIGENINLRRSAFLASKGHIGAYVHGKRIGVLVDVVGGDVEIAKDIAMHIAAAKPMVVSPDQVSMAIVDKEKAIYRDQVLQSGKPEAIADKIVEGKLQKFLNEVSLVGQPFVKNPDISVGQLLKEKKAEVKTFSRFELGEGIEKKTENFADEVMAQVKGA